MLKFLLFPLVLIASPVLAEEAAIAPGCNAGIAHQGGLILCTGQPGKTVYMDNAPVAIFDDTGHASIGLSRTAPSTVVIRMPYGDGQFSETLTIAPTDYESSKFDVGNCDKVSPRTAEQQKQVEVSWIKKVNAFKSFNPGEGFSADILRPTDMVKSSGFGKVRTYVCTSPVDGKKSESVKVHYGYDMAAPVGTPVIAPADGVVILGDPDLYFEGGSVFLDHGQGLVSIFMHLSEVDVKAGDVIKAGDIIAKTGNTGRTSGPHLHWAVKWRNTARDDRDGDFYIDPELLLEMKASKAE